MYEYTHLILIFMYSNPICVLMILFTHCSLLGAILKMFIIHIAITFICYNFIFLFKPISAQNKMKQFRKNDG